MGERKREREKGWITSCRKILVKWVSFQIRILIRLPEFCKALYLSHSHTHSLSNLSLAHGYESTLELIYFWGGRKEKYERQDISIKLLSYNINFRKLGIFLNERKNKKLQLQRMFDFKLSFLSFFSHKIDSVNLWNTVSLS